MGHVPAGPLPEERAGADLPRPQHRGARAPRARAARHRRRVGTIGEDLAASFLSRRGARIVGRNVRSGRGEIDLVARIDGHLVAVEVKTRRGVDPRVQMTDAKSERLRAAVARLRPRPSRIDMVAVLLDERGATVRWVRGG